MAKKAVKIIINAVIIVILAYLFFNFLAAVIGIKIPCRTAPLVPPFTQPSGPYDKLCVNPFITSVGVIIGYSPTYLTLFLIFNTIISIGLAILIVFLANKLIAKTFKHRQEI